MFDAFDVAALGFVVEPEEGEEAGEGEVAGLDAAGDGAAFVGEDEAAVFDVVEVAGFGEALDHVGDGGLFDLEGGGDIDDAGVALVLDQFVDPLEVVFGALAWARRGRHDGVMFPKGGGAGKQRQRISWPVVETGRESQAGRAAVVACVGAGFGPRWRP